MFVNFFLLCYALESSRPRLDFPLEDHGAAIFSSISYALVSLQRLSTLSFLSYLSDRFIKSSLIKLYSPQFRCMAALYTIRAGNVKQMFGFFKKRKIFRSYPQSSGGVIRLCTWRTFCVSAVYESIYFRDPFRG